MLSPFMARLPALAVAWLCSSFAAARAGTSADAASASRFFLSGDGTVSIENAHTREKVHVRFREPDGTYSEAALDEIDALFRSRGDDTSIRVSLRLVELIDYLQDRERPRELLLISGYRSEGYNAALIVRGGQAARTSMHTAGLAADLRFVGVDHEALWKRLRELDCCGAGYYAKSGFVHVDTGRPRFWEQATSRVGENLSAGNARVIARTDFDRYSGLAGMRIDLYAITLRPLRVASRADLVEEGAGKSAPRARLLLARADGRGGAGGCFELGEGDQVEDVLLVHGVEAPGPGDERLPSAAAQRDGRDAFRARVVLHTCEPRLEATPARIESNPIEVSGAHLLAEHAAPGGG